MLLAITDDWERWVTFAVVLLVAYLVVVWAAAVYWTYRDAVARTRDQMTQAIAVGLVAIFNLPGLLLYLIVRPKVTLAERYDRQLEAEALLHEIREQPACPSCRRHIDTDFIACPFCKAHLRTACDECGRALAFGWVVCPYCAADRHRADAAAEPAMTAQAAPGSAPPRMAVPERPRRASTARYTPPAQPAVSTDPAQDPGP